MSGMVKAGVDALSSNIAQNLRMVLQVEMLVSSFEEPSPKICQLVSRLKEFVMESVDLVHTLKLAVLQHKIVATHKAKESEGEDYVQATDDSVEEIVPGPNDILMPLVEAMEAAEAKEN